MAKKERKQDYQYNQSSWDYETKCRRCARLAFWFFSRRKDVDWLTFADYMNDCNNKPRVFMCDKCKRNTVQDIVSFTQPHDGLEPIK